VISYSTFSKECHHCINDSGKKIGDPICVKSSYSKRDRKIKINRSVIYVRPPLCVRFTLMRTSTVKIEVKQ